MAEGTITLKAKVDIAPEGIILRFDSVDSDLVGLFNDAKDFIVSDVKKLSGDYADLTIRSRKRILFVEPAQPLPLD